MFLPFHLRQSHLSIAQRHSHGFPNGAMLSVDQHGQPDALAAKDSGLEGSMQSLPTKVGDPQTPGVDGCTLSIWAPGRDPR